MMTATYTFDVFTSLDGFGGVSGGDWGGYRAKQGPKLLDHRLTLYAAEQRMVLGANTYRMFRGDAGFGGGRVVARPMGHQHEEPPGDSCVEHP